MFHLLHYVCSCLFSSFPDSGFPEAERPSAQSGPGKMHSFGYLFKTKGRFDFGIPLRLEDLHLWNPMESNGIQWNPWPVMIDTEHPAVRLSFNCDAVPADTVEMAGGLRTLCLSHSFLGHPDES
jgi:hypothetical protein